MQRVEEVFKGIVTLVHMYHRSLLGSDDTFIDDVGTTKFVSHARPATDFHSPSKQRRGPRVIAQPYISREYGRWGFTLGRVRPRFGVPERFTRGQTVRVGRHASFMPFQSL